MPGPGRFGDPERDQADTLLHDSNLTRGEGETGWGRGRVSPGGLFGDFVVGDGGGLEQVVLVLGVEDGLFDVGAGEAPDGLMGVPEAQRDDLGAVCR